MGFGLLRPGITRAVLQVHGYRCRYCGEVAAHADHIVSHLWGGDDSASNLTACCPGCNSKKGGRRLPADIENELRQEAFVLAGLVEEIAGLYWSSQVAALRRRRRPLFESARQGQAMTTDNKKEHQNA